MSSLMPWEELLSFETFSDYKNEYGPHTQAVVNAFETLDTISWFSQVGADRPEKPEERVDTWSEAIEPIFHKMGERYDADGHLRGPIEIISRARELKKYQKWSTAAFAAVGDFADYDNYIPSYFEKGEVEAMRRYMRTYLESLLVEIIASDKVDSTYYREQLSWFEAGHFPCGWIGEWPDGVLRVF